MIIAIGLEDLLLMVKIKLGRACLKPCKFKVGGGFQSISKSYKNYVLPVVGLQQFTMLASAF